MKPMTEAQLQRLALRTGGEVTVDGKVFNGARAQVEPTRAAPPTPPPAAPAPPAREMVPRDLMDTMLREQAEQFEQQLNAMSAAMTQNLTASLAAVVSAQPAAGAAPVLKWSFAVKYAGDRITDIVATAG